MFALFVPRAGTSIGTCIDPSRTEPIAVVRFSANRMRTTMTTILRRWRSSSICSKNVIRFSLARSESAAFAAKSTRRKWARHMDFPKLRNGASASKRISVFGHRIRRVAVAADLPVAEFLFLGEGDRADPLRALVRVSLWDEEAHRASMFQRQRLPVPLIRQEDAGLVQHVQGMRRGGTVPAPKRCESGRGSDLRAPSQLADAEASQRAVGRPPPRGQGSR